MERQNDEIVDKLYSMVEKNIEAAGKTMSFSKEVFLFFEKAETEFLNFFDTTDLDNKTFLQIAYVGIHKRLLSRKLEEEWSSFYGLPQKEFRYRVFDFLLNNDVRRNALGVIKNNYYDLH